MLGKSRTKVGRYVQTVLTRPNLFFLEQGKLVWKSGKSLIQFKLNSPSNQQAFEFLQRF